MSELLDLRAEPSAEPPPAPLARGAFEPAFEAARAGAPFRRALEQLLLELDDETADRLMQLLREARGAWFPLLRAGGGELLFLGNALSGSITPLAASGFRVTILERNAERARFALLRAAEHSPGMVRAVLGGDAPRLPFDDRSFDVVVQEDGLPRAEDRFAHGFDECLRVARGEVVLTADNRLAYKRSSGRRSDFRVQSPWAFVRAALAPPRGERTLRGYRSLFARGDFRRPRGFALYPHSRDFTHVVALDAALPTLTIGPMERKNRLKLVGRALGLFPWLTPSYALLATREARPAPTRLDRILALLAERTREPAPVAEQLVGTRGNTLLVQTRGQVEAGPGAWTLHLPLCPKNVPQLELHMRSLELVRARFPSVPVPEPLFHGPLEGLWLSCERRLAGWTAPQVVGDRTRIGRMQREVAGHFACLVTRPARRFSTDDFERQISARFRLVAAHAAVASTIANLERLLDEAREKLVGAVIPLVLYHADLRSKHVQVDRDGHVLGYLDWGTTEPEGLPLFDLLHLVVHEKKQELGITPGEAWRAVRDRRGLFDHEVEALDAYARALSLAPEVVTAIEAIYPVLVAAMAEKNWDFSRPRWLHRQFGL
ncbi:MAG: methyltransferase domain-containing protein [Planctomycetes bacterium]|nr:methyltransferase domain-containing protein [Planctomycetota bacterium]